MDWLDFLAVQGILKSLLQHHSSKVSILWHSDFFIVQLSHPYMTTGKTITLTRWTFASKVMSLLFSFGHSFTSKEQASFNFMAAGAIYSDFGAQKSSLSSGKCKSKLQWVITSHLSAAAAAESLQSCLTLCGPIDGSPPGFSVPGILQARTLEWVAISFSNVMKVKSESEVPLSDPIDCSLPGSSVHGIFQARILEWVAIAFS